MAIDHLQYRGYIDFGCFDITGDGRVLACDPSHLIECLGMQAQGSNEYGFSILMMPGLHRATSLVAEIAEHAVGPRVVDLRVELNAVSVRSISSTRPKYIFPFAGLPADTIDGYPKRLSSNAYTPSNHLNVAVESKTMIVTDIARLPDSAEGLSNYRNRITVNHILDRGTGVVISTGTGEGLYSAAINRMEGSEERRGIGLHFQFITRVERQ